MAKVEEHLCSAADAIVAYHDQFRRSEIVLSKTYRQPLKNKIALLLDYDGSSNRSLAISLATYGANIALLFNSLNSDNAQKTKRVLNSLGHGCLTIPVDNFDLRCPNDG